VTPPASIDIGDPETTPGPLFFSGPDLPRGEIAAPHKILAAKHGTKSRRRRKDIIRRHKTITK
jgi:hypothetical protein